MMFGVGPAELLVLSLTSLLAFGLPSWLSWRICVKAGFPGQLGLISLVPLGLFVLLIVLAVADWPVSRAMKAPDRN